MFFLVGEVLTFDIGNILADSVADISTKTAVDTQIARCKLLGDAQHVLQNKHLPIGEMSSTNANGGNLQLIGDLLRQLGRNLLKDDTETTGVFKVPNLLML